MELNRKVNRYSRFTHLKRASHYIPLQITGQRKEHAIKVLISKLLLDSDLNPVVTGELFLHSEGQTRGYFRPVSGSKNRT
jgi:hypothetical protein